jgi:hypothetical protein
MSPLGYRTVNLTYNFIYKPNVSFYVSDQNPDSPFNTGFPNIAMGWNSEPVVFTIQLGGIDASPQTRFFYWPISATGHSLEDPLSFSTPATGIVLSRNFNGSEPYPATGNFASLFAPDPN